MRDPRPACSTGSESCSDPSPRSADTRCCVRIDRAAPRSSVVSGVDELGATRSFARHPLARAVHVLLALPDRHAMLELLDHVPSGVERATAMRMRNSDRDAALADRRASPRRCSTAMSLLSRERRCFFDDGRQLALGHRPIGACIRCPSRRGHRSLRAPCRERAPSRRSRVPLTRSSIVGDVDWRDRRSRSTRSASRNWRNERDFVACAQLTIARGVLLIHGDHRRRRQSIGARRGRAPGRSHLRPSRRSRRRARARAAEASAYEAKRRTVTVMMGCFILPWPVIESDLSASARKEKPGAEPASGLNSRVAHVTALSLPPRPRCRPLRRRRPSREAPSTA